MLKSSLKILAIGAVLTAPALAQQAMDHSKMDSSKMQGMDHSKMMKNTAANPYAQAEMKMQQAMMKAMGSDASETWVRKMIEHHRGAVEISRIALNQAKDKEVRDQASKAIAEQNKDIGELQNWLKRQNKRAQ